MRYGRIAVMGLFLLFGGWAQPTDLTRGEIERRITSEESFEDTYNIE